MDSTYGVGGIKTGVELYTINFHCLRTNRNEIAQWAFSERHRKEDVCQIIDCMYLFVQKWGLKQKAKGDLEAWEFFFPQEENLPTGKHCLSIKILCDMSDMGVFFLSLGPVNLPTMEDSHAMRNFIRHL